MKKTLTVVILFVMLVSLLATGVSAVSTERFFADNPITDEQADQIVAKAEEAVALMQAAGTTNIKDLTVDQKNQLKSIANEAASIVGVSLVFKAGTVEIYKDGKLVETLTSNTGTLAYTGNTMNIVLVVSSIAIIALGTAVIARKRLANA